MTNILILCIIGYIVGSIPFGYIYTKIFEHIDLREFGSNSTGTTNVFRTGNKKIALATLLSDVLKATFLLFIVRLFQNETISMLIGLCCIIGHVYPIWLGFKGGKGVATTAGVFLFFSPVATLISAMIWLITIKFTKISFIASMLFGISFIIISIIQFLNQQISLYLLIYSVIIMSFITYTHKKNINNLIHNKENKI